MNDKASKLKSRIVCNITTTFCEGIPYSEWDTGVRVRIIPVIVHVSVFSLGDIATARLPCRGHWSRWYELCALWCCYVWLMSAGLEWDQCVRRGLWACCGQPETIGTALGGVHSDPESCPAGGGWTPFPRCWVPVQFPRRETGTARPHRTAADRLRPVAAR